LTRIKWEHKTSEDIDIFRRLITGSEDEL